MVLEKTLESPLDWKEIQPVHSEGDQPWDFFGRRLPSEKEHFSAVLGHHGCGHSLHCIEANDAMLNQNTES